MPLPSSHVVEVMARMRSTVTADLADPVPDLRVEIASPAQVGAVNQPTVTLFLYNVERSGIAFQPNAGLPAALILHVLVTAYAPAVPGAGDPDPVGLRELKLLMLVGRVFGAERDLGVVPIEDTAPIGLVANIDPQSLNARIYLEALDNEDINHIWTTQSQTAFRTSLPYRVEVGVLTPFAPVLEGPPILAVREDIEDAAVPIPPLGGIGRPVEPRPSEASGAFVAIAPGGGIATEVTLPPPQPGPDLAVSLLASSAEAVTLDLALFVLQTGQTSWTPAAAGRLGLAQLDTVPARNLQTPPSADATDTTITTAAGDAAYRITATPQGAALPVFAPVVILLEGVPLAGGGGG